MSLNLKRRVAKTAHSGWQHLRTILLTPEAVKQLFLGALFLNSGLQITGVGKFHILVQNSHIHEYCNQMLFSMETLMSSGAAFFKMYTKSYCLGKSICFIAKQLRSQIEVSQHYQSYIYTKLAESALDLRYFFKGPISGLSGLCDCNNLALQLFFYF